MEDSILQKKNTVQFEDAFDYKPLQKSFFANLEEKVYGLIRKKKVVKQIKAPVQKTQMHDVNPITGNQISIEIPPSYDIHNGLLIKKKTLAETVRDQIKYKFAFNVSRVLINGLALATFAIGSFMIYSELPTHPELVIGILLIAIAGNVIIGNTR